MVISCGETLEIRRSFVGLIFLGGVLKYVDSDEMLLLKGVRGTVIRDESVSCAITNSSPSPVAVSKPYLLIGTTIVGNQVQKLREHLCTFPVLRQSSQ